MTLCIGIDETIIDASLDSQKCRYVFVAAYSSDRERGIERGFTKKQRRELVKNNVFISFDGLDGFLISSFSFVPGEKVVIERKKDTLKKLIYGILEISDAPGEVQIMIDGGDGEDMRRNLQKSFESRGYNTNVRFIIDGDKHVGILCAADTLAYILRRVPWSNPDVEKASQDIYDENMRRILEESDPLTKNVANLFNPGKKIQQLPFGLPYGKLEKMVA